MEEGNLEARALSKRVGALEMLGELRGVDGVFVCFSKVKNKVVRCGGSGLQGGGWGGREWWWMKYQNVCCFWCV